MVRPSLDFRSRVLQVFDASLANTPLRTTSSPGFTDSGLNPARVMALGEPSSHCHFSISPAVFLTSRYTQACGLRQSSLVTVPVSDTGFFVSYSAARE